jgi:hypothetical protein
MEAAHGGRPRGHRILTKPEPSPLSSRPERSVGEGSAVSFSVSTDPTEIGRVPHVRLSVRGTKTTGRSPTNAFVLIFRNATNPRVPHISLVFREMWDTTEATR